MDAADRLTVIDAVVVRPARSVDLPAIVGLFADDEPHVSLAPTFAALNGSCRRAFEAPSSGTLTLRSAWRPLPGDTSQPRR